MRNTFLSSVSFVRANDESLALSTEKPVLPTSTETPASETAVQPIIDAAAKPAKAKRESKPAADKPAKAVKPVKSEPTQHENLNRYAGPSPTFRMHDRKLSPIVLGRVVNNYTVRDQAFCDALYAKYATKPFQRLDADAGNISRAAGLGYIKHVSGALDSRNAVFALTERFVRERKQKASATPKAAK